MPSIEVRKAEHISIAINEDVDFKGKTTGFEHVELIHRATTSLNLEEIELGVELFGKKLQAPIIIGAMTGGFKGAEKINGELAKLAAELGLGLGVGSQRAALENPIYARTFSVVREVGGEEIFVMGNIGVSQLKKYGLEGAKRAVEMIDADALAVHFNPVHEAVQIDGTPNFEGWETVLKDITAGLGVPVIAKEIGFGFSKEDVIVLESLGVGGLEVDGAGGTSWAAIEYYRALKNGNMLKASIAKSFWDWGVPTAVSLAETVYNTRLPVIAGGGIRSGLDAAKALALGAVAVAVARPVLKALLKDGYEAAKNLLKRYIEELRVAMFSVNASNLRELRERPLVITGWVREWLELRGIDTSTWARRCC